MTVRGEHCQLQRTVACTIKIVCTVHVPGALHAVVQGYAIFDQ
jgi:hypothetical protein